jgi:hypothetical protein
MQSKLGANKLSKPSEQKTPYYIYLVIILVSLSLFLITNFSAFQNPYAFSDDEQQTLYWMYQFDDPTLFQDDPLTDYASFFHSQGIAFVAIYYVLTKLINNPLLIFKFLSLLFIPLSAVFIFKIGKKLKNVRTGIILTSLFLIFLPLMGVTNAFYKNFAVVLFIIFYYFYISNKYIYSLITTVLISLFYAPMTLICLTLLGFSLVDLKSNKHGDNKHSANNTDNNFGNDNKNNKNKPLIPFLIRNQKKIYLFLLVTLLCLIIVSSTTLLRDKSQFGSLATLEEMEGQPEFYNGGRAPILPVSFTFAILYSLLPFLLPELFLFRWPFLYNPSDYILFYLYALGRGAIILGFLIVLFKKIKLKIFSFPKKVWFLPLSGVILFIIAKIFFFYLYVPKRYISYTLPLFLIMAVTLIFEKFLEVKKQSQQKYYLAAFFLFLLVFCFPFMVKMLGNSLGGTNQEENAQLYNFISALPKDILLAGHPHDMDAIPLFTKRKVYLNFELSHPMYSKYYEMIKERTYKVFYIYYTSDSQKFDAFCKLEKVDYFLFNQEHFEPEYLENKDFYINPFNAHIIKLLENKTNFYYNHIPEERIVFEDNKFLLISC